MKYIYIFILFIQILYSNDLVTANALKLYEKKTWLRLLHSKTIKNLANKKSFFLSTKKTPTPKDEMIADIAAYKTKNIDNICRFPARFFWLSKELQWKDYDMILQQCNGFNNWELQKNAESVSLVFVSSYLGNPASVFGHSFLKINKKSQGDLQLSDISVGYGADLPKEYGVLSYIYNGIFGGYKGSYTHKYYFMDDLLYGDQEFRDMWEYRLQIDHDKMKLLFMHLWELKNTTFDYYFFNRNCGFKMSELLEVISDEDIIGSGLLWYAPIETFYKIEKNTKSVLYYPSLQQKLYAFYHGLPSQEKRILNDILLNNKPLNILNQNISLLSKIRILDFIIDFYAYKLSHLEKGTMQYESVKDKKNKVLLQRIKLPVKTYQKQLPPEKLKITDYNRPRVIASSVQKEKGEYRLTLAFSPFQVDDLGLNDRFGDYFSVFNTEITIAKQKLFVSKIDLLKIRRLNDKKLPFDVVSELSWKLHIGMQKIRQKDYFASVGIGYGRELYNHIKLYGMVDFSLHSNHQQYRIYPYVGIFMAIDKFKFNFEYGRENSFVYNNYTDKLNMQLQYNINNRNSLFLFLKKEEEYQYVNMGYKWYF